MNSNLSAKMIILRKFNSFIKEHLLLIILSLSAFLLRVYFFKYRYLPEGDGCHYISFAKDFMHNNFSTVGVYWSVGWVGLIAFFSYIFKNVEFAGRLLSAIAGTALIICSFEFFKKLFNKKIAYYIAVLIAINFQLIIYSTLLFTESLYSFLLIASGLLGWISLEKDKKRYYLLLGIILGILYTIRNEAFIYAVFFVFIIVMRNFKKSLLNIIILFLGISMIISPLVCFYRIHYGRWTLGDKASVNFLFGDEPIYSYRALNELNDDFTESIRYVELKEKFERTNILVFLFQNKFFLDRLFVNCKRFFLILPNQSFVIPFIGNFISILLFIYGSYICLIKNKFWRKKYLYILSFPVLGLTMVSLCFMEERKVIPFIPFFLSVISIGIYNIETFLNSKILKHVFHLLLIFVCMFSLLFSFPVIKRGVVCPVHLLMKDAGLWMRENLSQSERMVLSEPVSAYYFYENDPNNFVGMIYAKDIDTLVRFMKFRKAKYLQVFSFMANDNPVVKLLFNSKDSGELEFIKSFKNGDADIRLYQLK